MKVFLLFSVLFMTIFTLSGCNRHPSFPDSTSSDSNHIETQDIYEFAEHAAVPNGQQIYQYGRDLQGQPIPFSFGPPWLSMHGGGCASCHGSQGQGGIVPMMCWTETPPITYKALVGNEHEHAKSTRDSGESGHESYTIDGIRIAVEQGIEPDGEELDACMPRWNISDENFRDLTAYLLHLDPFELEH